MPSLRSVLPLVLLLTVVGSTVGNAADFAKANRILRDGAIAYGDAEFDADAKLVRRIDEDHDALDVCQRSLEYAAALFSADQQLERANDVVSAVLDHQDVDESSKTFGNFRWWYGEDRVHDRNAVAFMSPWLAHISMEYGEKLTAENAKRLQAALARCINGVHAHSSGPDYTNIWLLKAASLLLIGRAIGQPELQNDAAERLDQWIAYTAENGVSEYNSPCYNAVNVYALEWIYHYATDKTLRAKTARCLDYFYADIFQNWHWEAEIGAGTHSRAYVKDRATGKSLVAFLLFKQCGQPLNQPLASFHNVFAVNDYPVPEKIRALGAKAGMHPFRLRYRILQGEKAVDCTLFMTPQFSLATQNGRRPVYNDRDIWDIPFKITYAGTKTERRASYVLPKPTTYHATGASVQHEASAIVLYEVDLQGDKKIRVGRLRLDIEPAEGGMCDEFLVDGKPYDRGMQSLAAGAILGWRVNETLVAVRLLNSQGLDPQDSTRRAPVAYRLGPVDGYGLCLDCPLADDPNHPVAVNDLNAGFAVHCATTKEYKSLADLLRTFAEWKLVEKQAEGKRQIVWQAGETPLQLVWDERQNQVVSQTVAGRPIDKQLRYDSPLIQLRDGETPHVVKLQKPKKPVTTPTETPMKRAEPVSGAAASMLPAEKNWRMVWHDEFDGTVLDSSKWNYRLHYWGYPSPTFTKEGVELDGEGHLKINLIRKGDDFLSGHLQTGSLTFDLPRDADARNFWPFGKKKPAKFMHKYGYYEIRCKLPRNDGWHAAFWLQSPSIGAHPDPKYCGVECDIMENYRQHTEGTIGCGNGWGGYGKENKWYGHFWFPYEETQDGWHHYAVDWSPAGYIFYADGKLVGKQLAPECPVSDVDQFILVSTECHGYHKSFGRGGLEAKDERGWIGQPVPALFDDVLPDCFEVDFVRVFDAE